MNARDFLGPIFHWIAGWVRTKEVMLMLMLIISIYPRANLVTKVTTAAP